jgi:hypothetical protein
MSTDRFSRISTVTIILLLLLILVRSAFVPAISVNAAKTYRYELVKVYDSQNGEEARKTLEKYTRDGWELIAAPFWGQTAQNWALGYMIFRK